LPGSTSSDGELLTRFQRGHWPIKARFFRVFAASLAAASVVGWSTDYVILGWTARGWGLLGLRVLGALAVVPLLAATR